MLRIVAKINFYCAVIILFVAAKPAYAQTGLAVIDDILLSKSGNWLNLIFDLDQPTRYEVNAQLDKRVATVTFFDAVQNVNQAKTQFTYNDPIIYGIAFERDADKLFAKIRFRRSDLEVAEISNPKPNQAGFAVKIVPRTPKSLLTKIEFNNRIQPAQATLSFTSSHSYSEEQSGNLYTLKVSNSRPLLRLKLPPGNEWMGIESVETKDGDTLINIRIRRNEYLAEVQLYNNPTRYVISLAKPKPPPPPPVDPHYIEPITEQEVLASETDRGVLGLLELAKREMILNRPQAASKTYARVMRARPNTLVGVYANLQMANIAFDEAQRNQAQNWHGVIELYQTVIRNISRLGIRPYWMGEALLKTALSYQNMDFHVEAIDYLNLLEKQFPHDEPYASDSYFYKSISQVRLKQIDEAIKSLDIFLASPDKSENLLALSHYNLGEIYYSEGNFKDADAEFTQGRRLNPEYPYDKPLLLFRMGETYYENADHDVANFLFQKLIQSYPDKNYSKLASIRQASLLHAEGRTAKALKIYKEVAETAPLPIATMANMHEADIYSLSPHGDEYLQAVKLYDDIIARNYSDAVNQDAWMRKIFTLILHKRYEDALNSAELFAKTYPDSGYIKAETWGRAFGDAIYGLINELFLKNDSLEVIKLYMEYKTHYLRNIAPISKFQVAMAYKNISLPEEALDQLLKLRKEIEDPTSVAHDLLELVDFEIASLYDFLDDLGSAEKTLYDFLTNDSYQTYRVDAQMLFGKIYQDTRRYDKAITAYQLIINEYNQKQSPSLVEALPEAYFEMGEIYRLLGEFKNAYAAYQQSIRRFTHPLQGEYVPEFVISEQFLIGDMLLELGQDEEALDAYSQAIELYPQNGRTPWAIFNTAVIHRRNGRLNEALAVFDRLVEMAKDTPGELWEAMARENQRDLRNLLNYDQYLKE